jgi:membrane protein YqaA with SNARE-associated domain
MDKLLDPTMWFMVFIVSLVGVGTKLVYYRIGSKGKDSVVEHVPKLTPERWEQVKVQYNQRGAAALLLTSIPVIGSALAAAAGVFSTSMGTFVILVLLSNLTRNWLLVLLFGQTISLLPFAG